MLLTSRMKITAITQTDSLQGGSYFSSIGILEWTIILGLDKNTFKPSMYPNPPANSKSPKSCCNNETLLITKWNIDVPCEGGAVWYNMSRELWGNGSEHFNKPVLGYMNYACLSLTLSYTWCLLYGHYTRE